MSTKEEETQQITGSIDATDGGYEVIMCQDSKVASKALKEIKDFLTMQGLGCVFEGDSFEKIQKWQKQKHRIFAMMQTVNHHDPKVIGLASERKNHSIWVHEIFPLSPLMEQPFRLMLLQWMESMAEANNRKIIVPKWLRESAEYDANEGINMNEAKELFDEGQQKMDETGEGTANVEHIQTHKFEKK